MGAFHAYDIRGIYNIDFTQEDVYKIGFYLPELLQAKKVLIGRDARTSSDEVFESLSRGITDAGADVYDAGLTTTPMIYWGTDKYHFDASVMITASHNPKEYNGMKVSGKDVVPIGYENGLKFLEKKIHEPFSKPENITKGKILPFSFQNEYTDFLQTFRKDFSNLSLVIDCSNGMSSLFAKQLLGNSHVYLFDNLDGSFPNHEPNPLDLNNLSDLKNNVVSTGADLGIIFDGDADRVMFVDEYGEFISPDLMIALLGHYFIEERGERGYVIQDIRSSRAVGEYLERMGATMFTWKVGRAYAAVKLKQINGIFGGELAGHYYFRDFNYSDSAFIACLLILNILSKMKHNGIKVSEAIGKIKTWETSGEINFKLNQKDIAIEKVVHHFISQNPVKIMDFDGFRIEFTDWWFNIRKSNTEPYLRLIVEARTKEEVRKRTVEIQTIIQSCMNL